MLKDDENKYTLYTMKVLHVQRIIIISSRCFCVLVSFLVNKTFSTIQTLSDYIEANVSLF